MPKTKPSVPTTYQLKVALAEIEPPIWRRLLVPSSIPLDKLHEVIQVAMGWTNSHLHQFVVGKACYGIPDDEYESGRATKDESRHTLAQIAKKRGAEFTYEYDFGDFWEHLVVVEEISPVQGELPIPKCLDGARHCPPEDVGSTPGYEHFLKAIKDPKHRQHDELLEWAGGSFDSEAFSVAKTNEEIEYWLKHGLPSADEDELF